MKSIFDYEPTDEELLAITGTTGKNAVTFLKEIEGTDSEKFEIAGLLASRGKQHEAVKVVETIEDEAYRVDSMRVIKSWNNMPQGALW